MSDMNLAVKDAPGRDRLPLAPLHCLHVGPQAEMEGNRSIGGEGGLDINLHDAEHHSFLAHLHLHRTVVALDSRSNVMHTYAVRFLTGARGGGDDVESTGPPRATNKWPVEVDHPTRGRRGAQHGDGAISEGEEGIRRVSEGALGRASTSTGVMPGTIENIRCPLTTRIV